MAIAHCIVVWREDTQRGRSNAVNFILITITLNFK